MAINDPRDIPGLVAWYSAEHEAANYADGAEMTGWTDLSGLGNHATGGTVATVNAVPPAKPYWRATNGPSGGPSVYFGSDASGTDAYFSLPAMFGGAVAGEVMATVKSRSASSTSEGNWIKTGSYSGGTHYPYSSTVYDDFGSTSRKTIGTLGTIDAWHRVNIWSAPSDYVYRQDGVSVFSTTANIVGWASLLRLGNSGSPSALGTTKTDTFIGQLGCVVLFNRKISTTERADLDAWLAANPSGGTTGPLTPGIDLAGTAPSTVGSFDIAVATPPPVLDLAGAAPAVTGAFDIAIAVPPVDADLAGTAPKVTGSFSLEQTGVALVDLSGSTPGVYGSFGVTASGPPIEVATDSVDRGNGMTLVTEWVVEVTPPVETPTRQRGHDYAIATSISSPTLTDGRPT